MGASNDNVVRGHLRAAPDYISSKEPPFEAPGIVDIVPNLTGLDTRPLSRQLEFFAGYGLLRGWLALFQ